MTERPLRPDLQARYDNSKRLHNSTRIELRGHLEVKGIAYPVATYRVVDLYAYLEEEAAPIRTELPHMRLDVDPELMSTKERKQAAGALREALLASRWPRAARGHAGRGPAVARTRRSPLAVRGRRRVVFGRFVEAIEGLLGRKSL